MKLGLSVAIATILLLASAANAKKKDEAPINPGPPPVSVAEFRKLATEAMLASFFDPGSAQITWDRGIAGGYWKPLLSKKVPGWFTCGMVNAKNRMGGYVGVRRFVVVEYAGRVAYSEVGDGGSYDFVALGCEKAISSGVLPLATEDSIAASIDLSKPRVGIRFSAVSEGAYIKIVEPGSAAAEAGLLPGMVISRVNDLPIKGFDEATMIKILQAPEKVVTLTIIGKGDITIKKIPSGN